MRTDAGAFSVIDATRVRARYVVIRKAHPHLPAQQATTHDQGVFVCRELPRHLTRGRRTASSLPIQSLAQNGGRAQ